MTEFLGLNGRVAIVTGAGQGIGRATAARLAQLGATVVVAELNEKSGTAAAEAIRAEGANAMAVAVDVSDENSVAAMARAVEERYGRIDILVNNAALFSTLSQAPFEQISLDLWNRVLAVNVTGPFLCARAVLPAMRRAKWGRIVNISSNTVSSGRPFYLHYVTSKSALVGMTRSLAREVGPDNVLVNAVMPALTRHEIELAGVTADAFDRSIDQQCLKRTSTPEELTDVIAFLASDAAGFITGQTIAADGGLVHR